MTFPVTRNRYSSSYWGKKTPTGVTLAFGSGQASGIEADLLPPKWFTKVPEKPLDVEIEEMLSVIEHAVEFAVGLKAETVFDLWQQLQAKDESIRGTERTNKF